MSKDPRELTKEEFIAQLVKAGWRRDEALEEYHSVMEEEEEELQC
jgi:hypothetical protein